LSDSRLGPEPAELAQASTAVEATFPKQVKEGTPGPLWASLLAFSGSAGTPEDVVFRDRRDAGRKLAARVLELDLAAPVVLGLPRGGVPVAAEVAHALHAPLDVFVARKVGLPGQPEFGIGAVAEGDAPAVRSIVVDDVGLADEEFDAIVGRERDEVARRVQRYRQGRELTDVQDRDVVLVDDGLATGVTAEAALRALRRMQPRRVVMAAPVGARETVDRLASVADDVVCLETPRDFFAVGRWYQNFTQTTDDEVIDLLAARLP
jgi:putative phosphoribosyl transferase